MPRIWDVPLLLLLALIWATAFGTIKVAVPVVGPVFLVACRCAIGALLMLLAAALARGARWPGTGRQWFWLVLTGIISTALPFWLIAFAELRITSSMTGVLMTVGPIVAILLGHYFTDDEKMDRGKVLGAAIGFAGAVYILREGARGLGGIEGSFVHPFAVILAAACYAIGGIMAKKLPRVSAEVIAAVVLAASSVTVMPLLLLDGAWPELAAVPRDVWLALLWLGAVPSGLAFYLRYFLIKRAGYGFVSYVGYLIPVFAVVIGNLWLDEAVLPETLITMAAILFGLLLTRPAADFPWNLAPGLAALRSRLG